MATILVISSRTILARVAFVLLYASCVQSFVQRMAGRSRSVAPLNLVDEFRLTDWGLFKDARIDFRKEPSFVVITGETGAGKSVLIGGLEYVCTGDGLRKQLFSKLGKETIGEATLTLKSQTMFRRSYSSATRRSTCEVDGRRSTAKALGEALAPAVRFWSSQNIDLLRPGNAGYYVDNLLSQRGKTLRREVSSTYKDWAQVNAEVARLRELKARLSRGNEIELLSHYEQETGDMQEHVKSLLFELQTIVGKLEEAEILNGDSDTSASASSGCGGVIVSLSPLQELSVSLGAVLEAAKAQGGLDLGAAWDVLCDAETLLEGLSVAIADSAGANEPGGSGVDIGMMMLQEMDQEIGGGDDSGGSGLGGSGPNRRLEQVQRQLNDLSEDTGRMQADFFEMGFGGSQLNDVLERVQVAVQEAGASLGAASQVLDGLRRAMPKLRPTLERMNSVRDEWEGLARKHSCREDALGVLLAGWRGDLVSMRNIVVALPAAELEEGALRGKYTELARSLSEERATAAAQLQRAVSCLLPQIEMADKHLEVEVRSAFGVGTDIGTTPPQSAVRPGVLGVGADGWDEVHLVVSSGGHGETSEESGSVGSGSETPRLVASTGDLSSGEAARLALALEASSYGGDAHQEEEQPLVVYDEIDAHVGGEAAAAVARLLKRIGKYRQVVAITHSPVVAAAADRHFVVSRDAVVSASARRTTSTICEVEGRARQTEVARMATGRLDTDAGQQLARELLRLDFGGQ